MAIPSPSRKLIFGVFELDPSVGRLLKDGIPVKLAPQPFKVLLLLMERRGNLVSREEIREHLWGSATFVDFERGINFSINQIRTALSDEVDKPRYVETLPKIGYRFIADVAEQNGHPDGATVSRLSATKKVVQFGEFELDARTGELRANGNGPVQLAEQSLQILLALLDKPGEFVSSEELQRRLWPNDTVVEFEHSIMAAMNRLRKTLGESAEDPKLIETLERRGYRWKGQVEWRPEADLNGEKSSTVELREALNDSAERPRFIEKLPRGEYRIDLVEIPGGASIGIDNGAPTLPGKPELSVRHSTGSLKSRRAFKLVAAGLVLGAIVVGVSLRFPRSAPPQVIAHVRLTNDGWRKYALVSDGVRLYFSERGTISQSSVEGGETTEVVTGLKDVDVYDISPNGSELLVSAGVQGSPTVERSIWIVSLPSGSPHQVGAIKALWASWAPDGEHIGYATNEGLYLAKKDGSAVRKLASVPGTPRGKLQFSPDGGRIRFDVQDNRRNLASIWEVATNGNSMRLLFPEIEKPLHTGAWSSDGKYFFFNTHQPEKDRDEDVWVSLESSALGKPGGSAVRLTSGPIVFGYPVPSPDGKRLYALGTQSRAELVRYDVRSNRFVPYLSGLSASVADISRDGQWVAYISYPDLSLWRCKLDGTQRLQLTSPPMQVVTPQWSPDGTKIVFTDVEPGKRWRIYVIAAAGGKAEEIMPGDGLAEIDPSWSPDGKSIVFGRSVAEAGRNVQRIDLKTHAISTLPGSEGLFSPRLSPDGRYVAAFPADASKLMLYDFGTEEWKASGNGPFQFNTWSRDAKKVYLLHVDESNEIVRFDVDRQKFEHVVSLKHVEQGNREWVGLSEDGSPLIVLDKSVSDVYRLDLKVP